MTAKRPPRRQRKGDRLLTPDATRAEIAMDHAIAPLDRLAADFERKWGIDRLPTLVSPDMAAKYGTAIGQLHEAMTAGDVQVVAHKAAVCMRGLSAMDAEATAAGHEPATGAFWEYDLGGFHFGVLRDAEQWQTVRDARPDLMFFTMREVALALKAYAETVPLAEVKKHFPDAQISKLPSGEKMPAGFFERGGDPIPFLGDLE